MLCELLMYTNDQSYDVIIIGGGPAGATAGAILADAGLKTLILERTQFPRFHIGESLMPETYWTFKRIGMLPKLRDSNFVRKYSVQFVTASGKESQPFYFDEMNPHECSMTWQVVRSEFDKMMLDNARQHGAHVIENANVTEILLEPTPTDSLPRATGVKVDLTASSPLAPVLRGEGQGEGSSLQSQIANRKSQIIHSKVVIDATGTNALLSKRLNLKRSDPRLRKASIFAQYKGAARDPDPRDEGATLVLSTKNQDGWFWYIPLPDDIVSVGVVGDIDRLITSRNSKEQTLEEEIQNCPALIPRLKDATFIPPVHVLSDFSYSSRRCAGEGWILIGDAFGFLDPMYSSGVFLALKSAEMAADCVIEGFQTNDFSAAQLSKWGEPLADGMQSIRKLVYAFYTKDFSFGRFVREFPHTKQNLVDLLIGNVFRPGIDEIFDPMSKSVPLPDSIPLESPPTPQPT
jgi:flavin-dependent dehydrogenase